MFRLKIEGLLCSNSSLPCLKSSSSMEDRIRLVDSDDEYVLSRRSSTACMGVVPPAR